MEIVPNGPADKAGLKGSNRQVQVGNSLISIGGDVITELNSEKVNSSDDLIRRIRDHRPGDNIELKILRDGRFLRINVILGEKPF